MSVIDRITSVEYHAIARFPGFRFGDDASVQTAWTMGVRPRIGDDWRDVKPSPRPNGHSWIYLGPRKGNKPHRLDEAICEAFWGERPPGTECLHRDGDRRDCLPDNLYWGIAEGNVRDPSVEYRTIAECNGYDLGGDGSVWSYWGTGHDSPGDVPRRMNPTPLERGHLQVAVKWNGEMRRFGVHYLIATAFHGPCPEGMECCHEDGIPDNNVWTNLRWGTPGDNSGDAVRHGTMPRGEYHWCSRFSDSDVVDIRHRYETTKITVSEMAELYEVSWTAMRDLIVGDTYKHLPGAVKVRPADGHKLTDSQEEEVCRLAFDEKWPLSQIAGKFGVHKQTVANILARHV